MHNCCACAKSYLDMYNIGCIHHNFLYVCVWLSQEKRSAFPRFYFIGDDDLLEILGQATNPTVIQSHLKKLFAGQKLCSCPFIVFRFSLQYSPLVFLHMLSSREANLCVIYLRRHP